MQRELFTFHTNHYTTLIMSNQQPKAISRWIQESGLHRQNAMRFLMAGVVVSSLLGLAGITLTGTIIALIGATPVLVVLSPILVPAAAVLSLLTSGFMFSGSCFLGALGVMALMYRNLSGKHPFGADRLEYARLRSITSKGRESKPAKEDGNNITQEPVQES